LAPPPPPHTASAALPSTLPQATAPLPFSPSIQKKIVHYPGAFNDSDNNNNNDDSNGNDSTTKSQPKIAAAPVSIRSPLNKEKKNEHCNDFKGNINENVNSTEKLLVKANKYVKNYSSYVFKDHLSDSGTCM
jgi:hypothetical protein